MAWLKYPLRLFWIIWLVAVACKGKKDSAESIDSPVEANPAYQSLNDSLHLFPDDATLYLRRATRLSQDNAHESAYADFQKAYSLKPLPEYALPFAANLEILGKHQERMSLLEKINQQFPGNPQVSRLLAETYASSENKAQALLIYNDILRKDSLDTDAMYEKAILLEQLKDTGQAIRTLQKAYSYQGVETYGLELAHLYAELKNPRALQICDQILRQDSARLLIDPLFIKGIYYANVRQYSKAIVQFDSCIARDWKTTDAYLEKGRAYFQLGNYPAAMQTFTMAITVTQTDPDAYYWLGRCYEAEHRNMEAVVNYRKAIALDKDFREARERMENLDPGFAHPSQ